MRGNLVVVTVRIMFDRFCLLRKYFTYTMINNTRFARRIASYVADISFVALTLRSVDYQLVFVK